MYVVRGGAGRTEYSTSMSGFFSCASSSRSTSSFRYSSERSWNSVVEMSVGTVGVSVSSDCLGGGFSLSGMMPRTLVVP